MRPSSNPAPLTMTTSASPICATWRAEAWKSCGSAPTGMIVTTSNPSPTTPATTSPRMLVVTTTVGRDAAASRSVSSPHEVPNSTTAIATVRPARVEHVICRSPE